MSFSQSLARPLIHVHRLEDFNQLEKIFVPARMVFHAGAKKSISSLHCLKMHEYNLCVDRVWCLVEGKAI